MGKKSTKIIVQLRVKQVLEWYLTGNNRSDILHLAAENNWGLSERSMDEYLQRARIIVAENNRGSIKEIADKIVGTQWDLYKRCITEKKTQYGTYAENGTARAILMDIAKLTGATSTPTSEIDDDPESRALSNQELKEILKNVG